MLERLIIAALLIALGAAAWLLYNRFALRRLAVRAERDPLLADLPSGTPVILYFTTPTCAPCRTQQKPALTHLRTELGDSVQIVEIDATLQPNDADRWGVFSAPTTFVIDRDGRPRHVNRGVASAETLRAQIDAVA
ncbi:MAG: thioredoxin family protein [bacterium]|nr:thioredoxin family protein [bacterium]